MTGYQWYRDQDDRELAEKLLHEAEVLLERLTQFAHSYQAVAHTASGQAIRRMQFRTLPYMFVYMIDKYDTVQIYACPHVKQEHSWRSGMP